MDLYQVKNEYILIMAQVIPHDPLSPAILAAAAAAPPAIQQLSTTYSAKFAGMGDLTTYLPLFLEAHHRPEVQLNLVHTDARQAFVPFTAFPRQQASLDY